MDRLPGIIEEEEIDETIVTYFLPTVGMDLSLGVPIRKHRVAWEAVADGLAPEPQARGGKDSGKGERTQSGESDAATVITDALAATPDEWVDVLIPTDVALRIVRKELSATAE